MAAYWVERLCEKNRSMVPLGKGLNLHFLLRRVLDRKVPGDVVEIGCYRGLTALLLEKTLAEAGEPDARRVLHVYDSFEGLPERGERDSVERSDNMRGCDREDARRVGMGWFKASREDVESNFAADGARPPQFHVGWFKNTLKTGLPETVAFAHLDGDFFSSTQEALVSLWPRLVPGAVVVLDDYCDASIHPRQSAMPGVKRAVDEWLEGKEEEVTVLAGGMHQYQAYFTKV